MEATCAPAFDVAHDLTFGFGGNYIRRKARQLIGRAGLTTADRSDIEQELALAVWERSKRFDPERGHWNVFLVTIVERQVATILRSRQRIRRNGRTALLIADIAEQTSSVNSEIADLRSDLDFAVSQLPQESQYLCYRLQHDSIAEISRRLHLSRTTIHQRIQRIRRTFLRYGLGFFSEKSQTGR